MAQELGVRSEKHSLDLISDAFEELAASKLTDDQAQLLVMINELYSDGSCRCEEVEATYGDGSGEAIACNNNLGRSREQMLQLYRQFLERVGG